jgi:hypothetical protein
MQIKELTDIMKPLTMFTNVSYIYDKENLLKDKESPYDRGFDIWEKLYEGRSTY